MSSITQTASFENSFAFKALAFVPILGPIINIIIENSILQKIIETPITPEKIKERIELIELKNTYKKFAIIRDVISIAATVLGVALSVFTPINLVVIPLFVLAAGYNTYNIYRNQKSIDDILNSSPGSFHVY